MARISLRAYNRDIERMIDGNQIDEAFTHCRHILESYPKHIDTYRLMGKTLLEAQRFGDASDVFHRVLSSVPDDFIAHLGMSIIREDESNLDAAIWHMERSFEVQPSNAAVQVELRRLYGLRDGLTPQKIQLTRGALARMSAKSNLFTQAIAELRTAMSDDPQRPDLQVVLADMYAQTGARMEAIETCNSLISKLPYCLVANRILADLLPETERADQAEEYKGRLSELDPYYAHLSPVAETVDQIPDGAVTIQRLDYSGESLENIEPAQPEWATSLGLNLDEEVEVEDQSPDWLGDEGAEISAEPSSAAEEVHEPKIVPTIEDESVQEISEELDAEPIPDWISDPEQLEGSDVFEEFPSEELDAAEEISVEEPPSEIPEPDELPGWMDDVEETDDGETPDWLREVMEEETTEEGITTTEAAAVTGIAAVLSDDDQEPKEDAQDISEDFPPFEDLEKVETEEVEQEDESDQGDIEGPIGEAVVGDVAGTAGIITGAAAAGAAFEASKEEEDHEFEIDGALESDQPKEVFDSELIQDESPGEADEIPDWLKDLGEDIPTPADEPALEVEPVEEEEEVILEADQVTDIGETEEISPVDETSLEIVEAPEEIAAFAAVEEPTEDEFSDAIPDWLSEVSPEGVPDQVTSEVVGGDEELEIVQAEIPEWLRKMEQEHKAELAAVGGVESLEALEFDSDFTELGGEDVPSWLMTAMETEGISEEDEFVGIEDIGEILTEAEEEQLATEIKIEEEIVPEGVEEELLPTETELEEIIEDEMLVDAAIPEQLEVEPISEELEIEEEPSREDEEEIFAEPVEEVPGIAELAAVGAIANEVLEDGDTQPVIVTDEEESAEEEIDLEELEALPSVVSEDEEIELTHLPDDEVLTEEDEDAAMAWLESLAAKQGVAEDELVTSPEERLEEPPDWVQEETLADESLEEFEVDEKVETAATAAIAGAAVDALISDEDEELEEIPSGIPSEWVPEIKEEPELTEEPSVEELPSDFMESELEIAEVSIEDIEPETEIAPSAIGEELEPAEEIPDWLTGIADEEEPDIEIPGERAPEKEAEEEIEAEAIETPAEVKIDLNSASLAQLEKIPGIGFIHAQRIVNFRAEHGPFKELKDLEKVPGLTSDMVEDLHNYLSIDVLVEAAPPISTHPEIQEAWNNISDGNIDAAVDQYNELINRDENLDEIIRDLQEALGKYPQDAALYQSLGDAFMRADMLQEALDAYNRAEDLIK
jgi:competence ComEA-like helix-hairpin-helix protein